MQRLCITDFFTYLSSRDILRIHKAAEPDRLANRPVIVGVWSDRAYDRKYRRVSPVHQQHRLERLRELCDIDSVLLVE